MKPILIRQTAPLALMAGAIWAQVGAPVLGYLPEGGKIHPVLGIAAAASAGPALDFGGDFLQAAVSPHQDFALVSSLSSGTVMIATPSNPASTTGTTTPVTGVSAFPSNIVLSPSGSSAVLWFASDRLLQIVSGLPASPVVRTVNASFLTGASGDMPAALAVSDDGAWGAGAWPSGVWAFGPNGEVRSLLAGERGMALTFFTGREDLAVATSGGVESVADVGGSAAVSALYTSDGEAPAGIGVTPDNSKLVLAQAHGNILTIDAAAGSASTVSCGCGPQGVFRMGGSLFRVTGLTGSVFRVFDARSGSVFQVPLAPGAGSAIAGGTR
jgi:hypothetical protein